MNTHTPSTCSAAPRLLFPCSGGSDVGAVSDQAARAATRDGLGRMYCLAGIGARVDGIVDTTRTARQIIAIDGCPQDCARKTLELAGFTGITHLRLNELGLEKGQTPPTPANIAHVVEAIAQRVA